jgi:hypothetical protein
MRRERIADGPLSRLARFADIYSLAHKVFLYTQDYSREYKFTLGQNMKRDLAIRGALMLLSMPIKRNYMNQFSWQIMVRK